MPYSMKWYRENRIVVGSFKGIVTVEELNAINEDCLKLVRQGDPPVHDIIDALELERIPFDLRLIRNSFGVFGEPNMGWIIVIARNPLFGFFGSTVSQLAGKRFRLVQNWDEALATLVRVDTTLVDLQLAKS